MAKLRGIAVTLIHRAGQLVARRLRPDGRNWVAVGRDGTRRRADDRPAAIYPRGAGGRALVRREVWQHLRRSRESRVNPTTPASTTRKPTERPRSLIANACEFAPMPRERMPVAGFQMNATGGRGEVRSETPTMARALFTPKAWLPGPPNVWRSISTPSCRHRYACEADPPSGNTHPTTSPASLMSSASLMAPDGLRSVSVPDALHRTA